MAQPTIDTDVCVVGAGIVGLAHAYEARRRGLHVVVLERDERAVGASVRNFGHLFVAAMAPGALLRCALLARERWLDVGPRAGIEVVSAGSLVLARHDDELAVLEAVATDEQRGARMLTAAQAVQLAPVATDGVLGALHARLDLRVDPRRAVAQLAAALARDDGARVVWGAHVHAIDPGLVSSAACTVRAGRVLVCPGPDYTSLPAPLRPHRAGLTRCRLQMLRVSAPDGRRYAPALLGGLSLLRYPAFTDRSAAAAVRARLSAERPELVAAGIHLIVTQLPDGDLILGDTHDYGEAVTPFSSEDLDELVLAEARALLGVPALRVRERWHGVYPTAPGSPFLVVEAAPGVHVVEVVSGVGMTTAFGLAAQVFDGLADAQRAA